MTVSVRDAARAGQANGDGAWGEHARRLTFLRSIGLFQALTPDLLTNVATALTPLAVNTGTIVCREGEEGDRLFLIEGGRLAVGRGGGAAALPLGELGAGEFFGELALLGDGRHTATVRAATDARLWTLPAAEFAALREGDADFAASLRRVVRLRKIAETGGAGRNLAALAGERGQVRIGRGDENDLVFASRLVSRQHAVIEGTGAGFRLRDLDSNNGTWLNGARIREAELRDGDEIQIGDARLIFDRRALRPMGEPRGIRIEAQGLGKTVKGGKKLLHDISLAIEPGEFVALVGGSGAGKSTLLDALAGIRPATSGTVCYNGRDLSRNVALFRTALGYVPQDDIIHTALSIRPTLRHAARLRLPPDTSRADLDAAVEETIGALGLTQQAESGARIRALSGGQRKRCSIGVELLTRPQVFFLDEPTSGLDPATDGQMMRLLRRLADDGSTVILTTHATKNVMLCDKVIFLARGGHLAFVGTPQRALRYFGASDFDEIYARLADEGTPEGWAGRFAASPEGLRLRADANGRASADVDPRGTRAGLGPFGALRRGIRQFSVLTRRGLDLLRHDRASFLALVAPPVAITLLLLALFSAGAFGATPNPTVAVQTLLVLGYGTLFFGISAGLQEITKELAIFRRERKVDLGIGPYLLAKVAILTPILLCNTGVMVGILRLTGRLPEADFGTYGPLLLALALNAGAGLALGLLVSAAVPTPEVATRLQSLVILPQVVFSGGLLAVAAMGDAGRAISGAMVLRWTFESLGRAVDLNALFTASNSATGQALLAQYGDAFAHDQAGHWAVIAAFIAVPLLLIGLILRRKSAVS